MLIPNDRIKSVFKKVKAVRDHMQLYNVSVDGMQLSVDTLRASIADMYGLTIEMYEVLATGRHVAGNVERYADGRAVILVKSELSDATKRFVAVKELCHLMIDEDDDWSTAGVNTLREMKAEIDLAAKDGEGVPNPTRTQQSEYLAWMAAVALMYPCEYHAGDRQRLADEETTVAKLGLQHDMPPYIVETALDHEQVFAMYEEAVKG